MEFFLQLGIVVLLVVGLLFGVVYGVRYIDSRYDERYDIPTIETLIEVIRENNQEDNQPKYENYEKEIYYYFDEENVAQSIIELNYHSEIDRYTFSLYEHRKGIETYHDDGSYFTVENHLRDGISYIEAYANGIFMGIDVYNETEHLYSIAYRGTSTENIISHTETNTTFEYVEDVLNGTVENMDLINYEKIFSTPLFTEVEEDTYQVKDDDGNYIFVV